MNCPNCFSILHSDENDSLSKNLRCPKCKISLIIKPHAFIDKILLYNPDSLDVRNEKNVMVITIRWARSYYHLFHALVFCSMSFWFVKDIITSDSFKISDNLIFISMPIFLSLICLFLIYYCLATFLNRTKVIIGPRTVEIKTSPLPWPFHDRRIPREEIRQLFIELYSAYKVNREHVFFHKIVAKTNSRELDLIKGIKTYEEAVNVELKIEEILGIKDQLVKDEYLKVNK